MSRNMRAHFMIFMCVVALGFSARAQVQFDPLAPDDAIDFDDEPVPVIKKRKSVDEALNQKRYIEHPNAEKGLIKIDKNKVYHYRVPESEQKYAASLKIAMYEPLGLTNPNDSTITYSNIYDQQSLPMILYEHEWQVGKGFGKWGWTLGTGLFFASGRGQFETPQADRPKEKFILLVVPISVGAVYRMQYFDSQLIVPYGGGGFDIMTFAERRDDNQNPALGAFFGAAPAAHAFAGVALQLGKGARSFLDLDREYGINRIWVSAEYRQYFSLSDTFDFGGDAINGGFVAEF